MDALLRPGMRLMRRLRVTGKFITIGLVLLVPLLVSSVGGWSAGSRDITFATRERDGLRLTVPLVQLVAALADEQGEPAGRLPSARIRDAVAEVDAAEARSDTVGRARALAHAARPTAGGRPGDPTSAQASPSWLRPSRPPRSTSGGWPTPRTSSSTRSWTATT